MWFTPETIARLRRETDPAAADNIRRHRAAEKIIEESGRGICGACAEEIVKNTILGHWESDFLLGYCYEARDRKHRPLVRYTAEDGVTFVARNDQTHPEPVSDERP